MNKYRYKSKKYQQKFLNLQTKNNMERAIDEINKSNTLSFQFVDIELSPKEKIAIDNSEVTKPGEYNYYGIGSNPELVNKIAIFLDSLGKANKSKLLANVLVNRIMKSFVGVLDVDSIWLTIRAIPSAVSYYDIPRWHFDGKFYDSDSAYQLKLAGVLKGPATLFKENTKEMRNVFVPIFEEHIRSPEYKNRDKEKDLERRKIMDEKIREFNTMTPKENQVVIFVVGNKERDAIHSEPKIDGPRIFFSIVAGNKDQIKEMANRHDAEFVY